MSFDNILKIIGLLSLLSLPISIWALCVAIKVKNFAGETLGLNKQIYQDRQSNFELYLNESKYKITDKERILLFLISVNNKSDSKGSFTISLELSYKLADNSIRKVIVEHNPKLMEQIEMKSKDTFEINPRVDERQTQTKWLCFSEPLNLPEDYQNSKYTIKLTDSHGKHNQVDAYIMSGV